MSCTDIRNCLEACSTQLELPFPIHCDISPLFYTFVYIYIYNGYRRVCDNFVIGQPYEIYLSKTENILMIVDDLKGQFMACCKSFFSASKMNGDVLVQITSNLSSSWDICFNFSTRS